LNLETPEEGRVKEFFGKLGQIFLPLLVLGAMRLIRHLVWIGSYGGIGSRFAVEHFDLGYPLPSSKLLGRLERGIFVAFE
jgi:hypothetical protein